LLWSLWTELGAPGWERKHRDWWIDPEALLLFTATVAPVDPRLQEETIAWCGRYRRFLSEIRVKSQLAEPRFGDPSRYQPQLGLFLGSIPIAQSSEFVESRPSRRQQFAPRSAPANLNRAAQLSLKLRSLLGVTAKAEVVRVLLARSNVTLSASDLVKEGIGYTKRAVRDALEDLRLGGFVDSAVAGNRKEYRLRDQGNMSNLMNAEPVCFPRWRELFAALRGILDLLEELETFRPATRPIEIRRTLTALDSEIRNAGFRPPVLDAGCDVVDAFETWACTFIGELASGSTVWMPVSR
jgi:hypothetical protein